MKCHLVVVGLGWLRDVTVVSQGCAGLWCGCPVVLVLPRAVWLPHLRTALPSRYQSWGAAYFPSSNNQVMPGEAELRAPLRAWLGQQAW